MDGTATAGDGTVRRATAAELERLLELAADEGWNPGLEDAAAFRASDPGGFLVATAGGRAVAGISVVRQDARSGFLGLYLCEPALRGRGHGRRVWRAGLERLAGCRRIGLDGVPAQQANYAREGFRRAWGNLRFAGDLAAAAGGPAPGGTAGADGSRAAGAEAGEPPPRPVRPADVAGLVALDRDVGGVDRSRFLAAWLDPAAATRRSLWLAGPNGAPLALGTIRACRDGFKVGPLLAPSAPLARHLLLALVRAAGAGRVVLDVPDANAAAVRTARDLGLDVVFETARMYRGEPPAVDLGRLHGVATLELG